MEFLDLEIMLLLAAALIGLGFKLLFDFIGTTTLYGVKIYLLLKNDKKQKKPQQRKKIAKKNKK
jgi:hypothetical protein